MIKRADSSRPPSSGSAAPAPTDTPSVFDWARREGEAGRVIDDLDRFLRRRRQRRQRSALAVTALLLMTAVAWRPWERPAAQVIASSTMERDAVVLRPALRTLPDGSVVELNSGATIEVDFSGPLRRVVLRSGEGHFQVAKNPRRPFVVVAGGIEVRAVGTAFAVEWAAQRVEVLVTEGRVAIEQTDAPATTDTAAAIATASVPPEPFRATLGTLDAGAQMVVTMPAGSQPTRAAVAITNVTPQAIHQRLSWRVPRLEFAATPVARAIVLFNDHAARHGGDRLVLGDPALGHVLLSGVLRADDIESLLRLLQGEFKIRAERQGSEIVLRRG